MNLFVQTKGAAEALGRVVARVASVARPDRAGLANELRQIVLGDNLRDALAGRDVHGRPLITTVREMTPALARRHGSGKPLDPRGASSRLVRLARCEVVVTPTGVSVEKSWPGFVDRKGVEILRHHRLGIPSRRGRLVRDVSSKIPDATTARLRDAVVKSHLVKLRSP